MIIIIDNYDSFTYNLYQFIGEIDENVIVLRNDKATIGELKNLTISHLVISPGPGFPDKAGISVDAIKAFSGKVPILGVCLGHQAIGYAFGGRVVHAKELVHGKASQVFLRECNIFNGLPQEIQAARYHSLIVEKESLPETLETVAYTADGEIMGVKHKEHETYGLQFHPESILTPDGKRILRNFLRIDEQRR